MDRKIRKEKLNETEKSEGMRRERKTQAPSKGEENRGQKERRKGQVEKERLGSESLVMFRQDQHSPWRLLSIQLACFPAQTVS